MKSNIEAPYHTIPLREDEQKEWNFIWYGRLNHPSAEITKIERRFWKNFTERTGMKGIGVFPEGVLCRPVEIEA